MKNVGAQACKVGLLGLTEEASTEWRIQSAQAGTVHYLQEPLSFWPLSLMKLGRTPGKKMAPQGGSWAAQTPAAPRVHAHCLPRAN